MRLNVDFNPIFHYLLFFITQKIKKMNSQGGQDCMYKGEIIIASIKVLFCSKQMLKEYCVQMYQKDKWVF